MVWVNWIVFISGIKSKIQIIAVHVKFILRLFPMSHHSKYYQRETNTSCFVLTFSLSLEIINFSLHWKKIPNLFDFDAIFPNWIGTGTSMYQWVEKNTGSITTKLGTKHPWVKGIQVWSKKGLCPSARGDNSKILEIHWWYLKFFFSRTAGPIHSSDLSIKQNFLTNQITDDDIIIVMTPSCPTH